MSCGACHISYSALKPPADPNNPKWENIDGLVGNQFSRVSQLLASGMSQHLLEWQLIARARPGVVDTSALPMDTVSNPGTMNTVVNFARRPTYDQRILKWRKASQCPGGPQATCWCEPQKPGKCWERSERIEAVQNILKGGEDNIGAAEAIQRVYFNIGSCAEQCWLNHVPDLRAIDPSQRNYGQTPFDIGQCRRDCASFRAIEDRLQNVVDFFLTARPEDLHVARGVSPQELNAQLDQEFGQDAVALGRDVFARTCAGCHSSQSPPFDKANFHATDPKDPTLRLDFLSNERPVLATRVGTYAGRALHSNHMPSRVWAEYAAITLRERPVDPALREIMKGSGRGYYRPPTLLSLWTQAPFMHNNAIGPEVCGKPSRREVDFYSSPYVDQNDRPIANPPPCVPFDPSVEGRYQLYKDSMQDLLNPEPAPAQGHAHGRGYRDRCGSGLQTWRRRGRLRHRAAQGQAGGPDQQPALQGHAAGHRAVAARSGQVRGQVQGHSHGRAVPRTAGKTRATSTSRSGAAAAGSPSISLSRSATSFRPITRTYSAVSRMPGIASARTCPMPRSGRSSLSWQRCRA